MKFPNIVEIVERIQSAIIHDSVVYHSYKLGKSYVSSVEDELMISTSIFIYSLNKCFLNLCDASTVSSVVVYYIPLMH